jgi:hypothetical protein
MGDRPGLVAKARQLTIFGTSDLSTGSPAPRSASGRPLSVAADGDSPRTLGERGFGAVVWGKTGAEWRIPQKQNGVT